MQNLDLALPPVGSKLGNAVYSKEYCRLLFHMVMLLDTGAVNAALHVPGGMRVPIAFPEGTFLERFAP